jgi:hypothetical protein
MRTQKDKGFSEIRVPKTVHFKEQDSPSQSGGSSPLLPPIRPPDRSRPGSPASRPPSRKHPEDEDWSRKPRSSPRTFTLDNLEGVPSVSPKKHGFAGSGIGKSSIIESTRRRGHDMPSPLSFGARGTNIKPTLGGLDPPPIPSKDEKRERTRDDREKRRGKGDERRNVELTGIGLGIHGHGVRERVGRV